MIAENMELTLADDFGGSEIVELNFDEIDEIAGGPIWFAAIPVGVKVAGAIIGTGAAGAAVGYGIGYWANRD